MKIIDWERKGHVIRIYLGKDELEDWTGDDWNDVPYEYNGDEVYDEFVEKIKDIVIPWDNIIFEPCDGHHNSPWSKNDIKERKIPFLIVIRKKDINNEIGDFDEAMKYDKAVKFYFGDPMK